MPRRHAQPCDYEEPLQRVRALVEANPDDAALTPARLAREAGFALHHFHRVFRGMTGMSVGAYVRAARLERAARHLRHTQRPITDLAFDAGYEAPESFSRAFRSRFGESPSDFRAHMRPEVAAPAVTLRELPDAWLWSLRHTGSYSGLGSTFGRLFGAAAAAGVSFTRVLGLNHDDPDIIDEERLRYDACLEVPTREVPPFPLEARTLPGGLYAVAVHRGPLDTLLDTYLGLLGVWTLRAGVRLCDEPVVEISLSDPANTPPAELVTELLARLVTIED
jgi:AraC family transcriptional regulator